MTYPIQQPCPACCRAAVTLQADSWDEGRCVYVDEPVRCALGCHLSSLQVEQLLRAAYQEQGKVATQLRFPLDLDAPTDTLRVA